MEIDLAVIAEHALVEASGKMAVLGIFDVMGSPAFPFAYPRFFVCVRIACRPIEIGTDHVLAVVLQDQDGGRVGPSMVSPFKVPNPPFPTAPSTFVQAVFGFIGVGFSKPGTYSFEIAIDGQHRRTVTLHVLHVPTPPPGG
jgi:hypothetical protein